MFAVVEIAGKQFKVNESGKYYVPRLSAEPNAEVTFDKVLLVADDKSVKVGSPVVGGVKVSAKVIEHIKDDKVIVFKKKRIISYRKLNGHRQQLTKVEVTKIG
ncbi:MAG: 50S ribosomal protein L21 [Ignavibacteriales bacterium]|nr:50S ribosomal protein L21 [Ignavibacteriales bacterium]MCF8304971.1 50S ribosomal protein L21 [Ignavibacteriales bacterium]MCF8314660.1 50S ribosomal protein L21 [Ignavibacteriales bacterium]MCF8436303.1 50S ribosomal protein L21 [Ignavibacteriales bacterium]